jgi:hypothetical protein
LATGRKKVTHHGGFVPPKAGERVTSDTIADCRLQIAHWGRKACDEGQGASWAMPRYYRLGEMVGRGVVTSSWW